MRGRSMLLLLSIAATAGAAQAASLPPEAQIAKALGDRVPGKPTNCIQLRQIRSSQIVDKTAILYEMAGGTIYVNRPTSGATFLRRDLTLITDTHSTQLCSIDIVRLYDSGSRFESGSVGLGEFVPYTRAERPKRR